MTVGQHIALVAVVRALARLLALVLAGVHYEVRTSAPLSSWTEGQ